MLASPPNGPLFPVQPMDGSLLGRLGRRLSLSVGVRLAGWNATQCLHVSNAVLGKVTIGEWDH